MPVTPYLFFNGRCEEAIEFYKNTLGAKVEVMMRFKESPEKGNCAPGNEDKVMHACLRIGDTAVMASDGMAQGQPDFKGFSLALSAKDPAEADRLFGALAAGGQVHQPLIETFFSPRFGMLADKFGVGWMVVVEQQAQKGGLNNLRATKFTIRWQALNATPDEQKVFDTNHDSMQQGWTGTFDQLAAYLAKA